MMGWMKTNFNNDKDNIFTKEINDMSKWHIDINMIMPV
jgi:hypothetical protein